MLQRLRALRQWAGRARGAHPDEAELVAWHDGELDPRRLARIGEHALRCPDCRLAVRRISRGWEESARIFARVAPPPPLEPGAMRLRRVLRSELLTAAAQAHFREQRNARLIAELAPYFGAYPVSLLAQSAGGGTAFQTEMSRLANAFLGRKAALSMLDRIDLEAQVA